jgi:hypothetical protein
MKMLRFAMLAIAAAFVVIFLTSIVEAKEIHIFDIGGVQHVAIEKVYPDGTKHVETLIFEEHGKIKQLKAGDLFTKQESASKKAKKIIRKKVRAKVLKTVAPKVSTAEVPSPFGGVSKYAKLQPKETATIAYKKGGDSIKSPSCMSKKWQAGKSVSKPGRDSSKIKKTCKANKTAKVSWKICKKISIKQTDEEQLKQEIAELSKQILKTRSQSKKLTYEAATKKVSPEVTSQQLKDRSIRKIEANNPKCPKYENKVAIKAAEKIMEHPKVSEFWLRLSPKDGDDTVKTFVRVIGPGREEHRDIQDASRWYEKEMPTWAKIRQVGGNEPYPVIVKTPDSEVPAGKIIGWQNKFHRNSSS